MARTVITQQQAERQTTNGVLVVPEGALITPLAADWIRERTVRVQPESSGGETGGAAAPGTLFVLGAASTPQWSLIEAALRRDGTDPQPIEADGPVQSLDDLLGRLAASPDAVGLVLTDRPGAVACYVNKHPGVRAVAPATINALRADLPLCGPNLLALDPAGRGFVEVRRMAQALAASPPGVWADETAELRGRLTRGQL